MALEDPEHFASRHAVDLCNTVRVPQDNTDLGGSQTFLRQFADMIFHLRSGDLQPAWGRPLIRQCR